MSGFKFIDLDPREAKHIQRSRHGRMSYPILKAFLESNKFIVQFDPESIGKTVNSLGPSLSSYAKSHELPVKAFQRDSKLYLLRLDIDEDGNVIEDWMAQEYGIDDDDDDDDA